MKHIVPALLLIATAACGFQPVYAPVDGKYAESGMISVSPIDGRQGHMLRRALQQELAVGVPGLTEKVTLSVTLGSNLSRLALRPDGAASRSSIVANGSYRLEGENTRVTGRSNVEAGFLVPDSPYGDIAAQTDAGDRAMRVLAKQIADDIRLKFAGS
ncbi:putative lipoprotein [Hyphomonas neptunium ATCC 15444]|uniref:Putative lipoprotein n=2 Tax=Hyphomonas TaxID=85 RepID=Q0BWB4_HYPNA|nr:MULTISPECIES: LPS assembly lipoprotein LptE [Hyphomonas]ABI77174.1 putative lipoprotein [Hyphomonas neptunium ATCC 15444]KCZ94804.1 putative lipoprotein [Hyphomonas hirschiana VP5]